MAVVNDPQIEELIQAEHNRQTSGLEMIPSENHTSADVMAALGSCLTDKYSEGYPGKRYYGGCEFVDKVENLARDRAKELFGSTHANVQAHSGCPANLAAYYALLDPGDTLMGLSLTHGGHMTHGLKLNFSSTFYNSVQYHARKDGYIDIDEMYKLAKEHKPKLIVGGGSAYPRYYEWEKYKEVADSVGAFFVADMSHVAGLVAAGEYPTPVGIADIVTTTTHKTLRGPRGALLLANGNPSNPLVKPERTRENIPSLIDRAVIPGLQGGPHNHQTAGIAVALKEALQPSFKQYGAQVIANAQALAKKLLELDYTLVTGGTDSHLLLIDLTNKNISGKEAEAALGKAGITVNKNTIPFDPRSPFDPSGIRLGTPALTSRGMKESEMELVAQWINRALSSHSSDEELAKIHEEITQFCQKFPLPSDN